MGRTTKPTLKNGQVFYPNPYGKGVVYSRGGKMYLSFGEVRRTCRPKIDWPVDDHSRKDKLGLTKAQREAVDKALSQLRVALQGQAPIPMPKPQEEPGDRKWIFALCAEYEQLRKARVNGLQIARRLLSKYIMDGGDFPVSFAALEARLKQTLPKMAAAEKTIETEIGELRIFIRWLIDRQILSGDPLPVVGSVWTVTSEIDQDNRRWEIEEVAQHIKYLQQHDVEASLLLRMMFRLGIRVGEMMRLRWEHITDTTITIVGKAAPSQKVRLGDTVRAQPYRIRDIPLYDSKGRESVPGILALLHDLRQWGEAQGKTNGRIFRWEKEKCGGAVLSRVFQSCRKACGHDVGVKKPRALKHYRNTAIWYWEYALGLPIDLRASLAGHNPAVQLSNYRSRKQKAEDLALKIGLLREAEPHITADF